MLYNVFRFIDNTTFFWPSLVAACHRRFYSTWPGHASDGRVNGAPRSAMFRTGCLNWQRVCAADRVRRFRPIIIIMTKRPRRRAEKRYISNGFNVVVNIIIHYIIGVYENENGFFSPSTLYTRIRYTRAHGIPITFFSFH